MHFNSLFQFVMYPPLKIVVRIFEHLWLGVHKVFFPDLPILNFDDFDYIFFQLNLLNCSSPRSLVLLHILNLLKFLTHVVFCSSKFLFILCFSGNF